MVISTTPNSNGLQLLSEGTGTRTLLIPKTKCFHVGKIIPILRVEFVKEEITCRKVE